MLKRTASIPAVVVAGGPLSPTCPLR